MAFFSQSETKVASAKESSAASFGSEPKGPPATSTQPAAGATSSIVRVADEALRSALLTSAVAEIVLRPAGWVVAGDVAEVRADSANGWFVFDFRSMRTINGVAYNPPSGGITFTVGSLKAWTGTQFGDAFEGQASGSSRIFSEQLTERLLVQFTPTSVTVDLLREHAALSLPGAPGDLRLKIGQKVVWAEPGPVRLNADGLFVQSVDIKDELSAALEAAGEAPLEITLSAAYPAIMELEVVTAFQRRFDANLGANRSLVFEQPGVKPVPVTLGEGNATWSVHAVELSVEAELPELRTLPARAPARSQDILLKVSAGHALALGLGSSLDQSFQSLASIGVMGEVSEGGAEVAGALYAGTENGPDTSARLAVVPPLTLEPTDEADWLELALGEPLELGISTWLWLETQTTRGELSLSPVALLDEAPGPSSSSPASETAASETAEDLPILRGPPGGPFAPFKVKLKVGTSPPEPLALQGLTRVTGVPRDADGIPALTPRIGTKTFDGFTPERSGTAQRFELEEPLPGTLLAGSLPLELESAVPGTYRLTQLSVFYTLGTDSPGGTT